MSKRVWEERRIYKPKRITNFNSKRQKKGRVSLIESSHHHHTTPELN
jgi:hypothetical protein